MDICIEKCVHEDIVEQVASKLPSENDISRLSDIFKALSDPSRLKIVAALCHAELCVCDISVLTRLSDSAASHQLRLLRNLKIVSNRRAGKIVYYRLTDDHVRQLFCNSLDHVTEKGCNV